MQRILLILALIFMTTLAHAGKVNINTASEQRLDDELAGVGMALAGRIVRYRQDHGPFRSPEDIQNVPYVGVKTYQRNRELILVSD